MGYFDTLAKEFLAQNRIAVAGVSRNEKGTANTIYRTLRDNDYAVFPINPNADTVEGDPCFKNIGAIPGSVDGVVIITRPELTEEIVRDCISAGVPRVWMHSNTFSDSSVSDSAAAACRENGISVIAGGCPMMFLEFGHKCMKWFLNMAGRLPDDD
jgi:uncharacterized protein